MADIELVIEQSEIIIEIDQAPATGGGGTTDHAAMSHLDFGSSGHTGFEPAKGSDDNYVTDTEKSNLHAPGSDNQDLSGKVDKITGKGLSTEDYTTSEKNKLASLSQLFLGKYTTLALLQFAHASASPGQYADVDPGSGIAVKQYNWDDEEGWVEGTGGGTIANTDALAEGFTNLYFLASRVRDAVLTGISFVTNSAVTATDSILVAFGKLQAQITGINNQVKRSFSFNDSATLGADYYAQNTSITSITVRNIQTLEYSTDGTNYTTITLPGGLPLAVASGDLYWRIAYTSGKTQAFLDITGTK